MKSSRLRVAQHEETLMHNKKNWEVEVVVVVWEEIERGGL
jgi:hypothetical protein